MSVNIQTTSGLLKISGDRVTKNNVVKALGYTPANVDELPEIFDDSSDNLVVVDSSGNIATKIDKNGIKTVSDVVVQTTTETHSVVTHLKDAVKHITASERATWNGKSDFSGEYTDLKNKPDIQEDSSGSLQIADPSGNIVAQIDAAGIKTCEVTAGGTPLGSTTNSHSARISELEHLVVGPAKSDDPVSIPLVDKVKAHIENEVIHTTIAEVEDLDYATNTRVDGVEATIVTHTGESGIHVTPEERVKWNNKSDFSGNYVDLVGEPDIKDDESNELSIADSSGQVVARITNTGLHVNNIVIGSDVSSPPLPIYDVGKTLFDFQTHTEDNIIHVSTEDRQRWDGKTTLLAVQNLINPHIDNADKHVTLSEKSSWNTAVAHIDDTDSHVTSSDKTKWNNHTSATDVHITPTERSNWNSAYSHISDTTKHITATERSNWNALIATHESDVNSINRKLIEIGDLKEVESSFVTNYTISSGKASATVEAHMFENFYIHPTDTYNVSVTYDEWAGTVCEQRILAENTGAHIVTVSRKDGAAVTSSELNTIKTIVEHIKTGFSIYFNKLYNIVQGNNDILEENLTFDTTTIITQE